MKLIKPLPFNLRVINKVRSLPNIHTSKINNDNSINNISSTTNASVIKNTPNNSILIPSQTKKYRLLKKIKLNNNINKSMININNTKDLFYSTKNIKQKTIQILENADNILKERTKFHALAYKDKNIKMKKVYLNLSKDISHKNFSINLLKENITKINEIECVFNRAIKEFDEQYEQDHKNFIDFVEQTKDKQKKEEDIIIQLKEINEQKEKNIEEEININKKLEITLEKKLKEFYVVKGYGAFFHRLIAKPFAYRATPTLSTRVNTFEKIADSLINIYETKDKYRKLPKELEDDDIFFKKYKLIEDSLFYYLKYKENIDKQIEDNKNYYENELKELRLSLNVYQKDLNCLKNEEKNINKYLSQYIINDDNNNECYLKDIFELGKELEPNIQISILNDNFSLNDFFAYIKIIKESLNNLEKTISKNISEIEKVFELGEKEDKLLINEIILNQRNINKLEYKLSYKQFKERMKYLKDLKIAEKSKKIIIKGRKIIFDYPIKKKNQIKKIIIPKNNEEIGLDYSYTDEDEEKEK